MKKIILISSIFIMSLFFCTTTVAASANYGRFYANAESYGFVINDNYELNCQYANKKIEGYSLSL